MCRTCRATASESGWPLAGTYTAESIEAGTYDTFIGTPTWFGFDAFGYLEGQAQGDLTSYGAIFDPANAGRAALLNEPITSVMKVATFLRAPDRQNSRARSTTSPPDDLATCFDFLNELKQAGQFRLFWSDFGQLVDLLVAGEIWVGDFWASACAAAVASGATAVFVNDPAEGSNGWIQGADVSAATEHYPEVMTFINWYLDSGVPGAVLGVQGYYSPRPDRVEPILSEQSTHGRGHLRLGLLVRGRRARGAPGAERAPEPHRRLAGLSGRVRGILAACGRRLRRRRTRVSG